MNKKEFLTTEYLRKNFASPFELVNYAIDQAKDMIVHDRACTISTPIQNRAYQILLEISSHQQSSSTI